MVLHLLPQPLGECYRGIEHRAGKNEQEFLSPVATNAVDLPRLRLEELRELFEHRVSRLVSMIVVHALEPVYVAHNQRDRFMQSNRVQPHLVQTLLERASVLHLGEPVGEGDLPQLVVQLRQLFFSCRQIGLESLDAEQRVNPCLELGEIDRLGDVVVGAGVQTFDLVLGRVERRLHDHGNEGKIFVGLQSSDDFHAVHLRHHHVEEDEIGADVLHLLQRRLSVVGSIHFVAARLESGAEELDVVLVIVYDQDPVLLVTLHCFCRGISAPPRLRLSAHRASRGIRRSRPPSPSRDRRRGRARSAR